MDHQTALTQALKLSIEAPANRLDEILKLAYELAELCTPMEIEHAKATAMRQIEGDSI